VPLAKIVFKPGVNRETTSYGAENGWYDSDLIRFRKGRPEKMGGWSRLSSTAFEGTGRSLHVWAALDASKYMGANNAFTTDAAASGIITVTDAGHGAVLNDFVTYSGATTFDGLTTADLNKEQQITQVIDANSYKVDTGGTASSGSVAGGGSVILAEYQINTGLNTVVSGTGYGAGFWGGVVASYSATTLSSGINDSVTSIPLTDASDFDTASTTLDGTITVFSSSIDLIDASSFPDIGTIKIGSEYIRYKTKTDNTLSDLSRNSDGSTIAGHTTGAAITFVGLINIEDELILYTGKTTNTLDAGVVRSARGTTNVAHSSGVVVKEANDFIGWGSAALTTASTGQNIRLWSQDNWGEDLVFSVYDGTPYYWDKTLGLTARGTTLASQSGSSDAPTIVRRIMVSGADRHIIAFACNAQGATTQDLLMVRWSSQEAPFDWTPTATNTSGSQRISSGSEIMAAQKTRQEILIWTDANLHAMRFVGPPLTFGFSLLASNISIVGPNTVITIGDRVFWMDRENFYVYTGRMEVIPCTVLRYVFDDINLNQSFKFFAASNRMFDEVFWFYVSSGVTEIDRYVKFNFAEGTWDIGTMVRTAWVDYGIHDNPRATGASDGNEYVYIQETGTDADGEAMSSYIQSADFDLGDGNEFMFINRLIPDVDLTGTDATVDYVVKTRNYPGSSLATNSTNAVIATTDQSFLRARSRQAVIRIQSTTTDVAWTLGDLRLDVRPDGRR